MGVLDLDAARAARAAKSEAEAEGHTVVLDGQEFALPPEMPAAFALHVLEGNIFRGLEKLFGPEQYAAFDKIGYSIDDLIELADGVAHLYGFENVGEALASRRSSSNNGKRSRPTSKRSTDSTSATSSGANGR